MRFVPYQHPSAFAAQILVSPQRCDGIGHSRDRFRQHISVLHRRARTLPQAGLHRVRCVAEQADRAAAPLFEERSILGRHGHLSNVTAAETAAQIMSARLGHLYLAHLSRECNTPELAQHIMAEQLFHIGATHVRLELAAQNVPCTTLEM